MNSFELRALPSGRVLKRTKTKRLVVTKAVTKNVCSICKSTSEIVLQWRRGNTLLETWCPICYEAKGME